MLSSIDQLSSFSCLLYDHNLRQVSQYALSVSTSGSRPVDKSILNADNGSILKLKLV